MKFYMDDVCFDGKSTGKSFKARTQCRHNQFEYDLGDEIVVSSLQRNSLIY